MKSLSFILAILLTPPLLFAEENIQLKTADGKTIQGLLYGKSELALVLCHGRKYATGGASFREQCEYLENQGVMCLAFSFRGYPSETLPPVPEGGENDILAAMEYLSSRGATHIFVLGSSMGGFIALGALPKLEKQPGFSGVIAVSAFDPDSLRESATPKLFIAAEDDAAIYARTQACFDTAAAPKQMIAFKTGGHGQATIPGPRTRLLDQIVAFMKSEQ